MSQHPLTEKLIQIAGRSLVLTSARRTRFYRRGFRSGEGTALAVVFPTTLWMQWQLLQACVEAGAIVILQAANTGLTEGSSPSGHDYDRPVVIISTRRLQKLVLLNHGQQVLAFPGTSLFQLENALRPLGREPHSVIGSSCIGASVVGGIANNSGGALIQRGPAYTELALFARVDEQGQLQLVNHLGIELGDNPQAILQRLDDMPTGSTAPTSDKMASDREYQQRVRDTRADSPARFNADPRRLYEASGCAGKLAVFAVRLDTFASNPQEQVFYLGTNNPHHLTGLRQQMLQQCQQLPVVAEYIHRTAFAVARNYGKDTFLAIHKLGTGVMPKLFTTKAWCTDLLNQVPLLPQELPDKLLQWLSRCFPEHLPPRLLDFHQRFEHHLLIKMAGDGIDELQQFLQQRWSDNAVERDFLVCTGDEAAKATLHRFAVAGAAIRYQQMHTDSVEELVALDIALPRNCSQWQEQLPPSLLEKMLPPLYYGHFFCQVFHQDYLVRKGHCPHAVKSELLSLQRSRGAEFPAEHNVGHLYEAPETMQRHYQTLDPTNTFNPGIGKMSKRRQYGCC